MISCDKLRLVSERKSWSVSKTSDWFYSIHYLQNSNFLTKDSILSVIWKVICSEKSNLDSLISKKKKNRQVRKFLKPFMVDVVYVIKKKTLQNKYCTYFYFPVNV